MKRSKINTTQLAALRAACSHEEGLIPCDRSTGKALRDRGFAVEITSGTEQRKREHFFITPEGRQRARFAADTAVKSDSRPFDPSLMQDVDQFDAAEGL